MSKLKGEPEKRDINGPTGGEILEMNMSSEGEF